MRKFLDFMEMEKWEFWLYVVILPLGFIIAGTIGCLPAIIK